MCQITQVAFGSLAYADMLALRRRLLRRPLGLDFSETDLAAEAAQIHLACWHAGEVIGTVLLVPPDPHRTGHLRQMAVEPAFQRRGLGAALVAFAEDEALRLGASLIALNARVTAASFYRRLGYAVRGPEFLELAIPHVRMDKPVNAGETSPPA